VIYYFIYKYPNLRATASQRGESYYPIIKKITNKQLTLKKSIKRLVMKIYLVLWNLTIDKNRFQRDLPHLIAID